LNTQIQPSGITLGSLFDGIGGFPYAGSFFGIEPLWASEILPQAVSVTKRHFPDMQHYGDITALDGAKLPPVDIITFGSPCQDLSTAGRRAGIDGARSSLFYEAIRIIDEMRRATDGKYPTYAVWENVPGALSSGRPRGADFAAVLTAFTKTEVPIPESGSWANAGMAGGSGASVAWRVLNAQHFGVPQRRRRVFLVCRFGAGRAGEVLFVEKSLRGYPAPGRETGEGTAADAPGGAGGAVPGDGGVTPFACNQRDEVRSLGTASGALAARPGMKQQTFLAEKCLTPWDTQSRRVHSAGGAWPALYAKEGGGHGYAALPVAEDGIASTLTAGYGTKWNGNAGAYSGGNYALAPRPDCLTPWDTQQSRVYTGDGASPTLAGADGGGGRNPAGLIFQAADQPVAAFLGGASAKARSIGYSEEVSPTLKSGACGFSSPCLCEPELARTLTAHGDGSPNIDGGPNVVALGVHQNQTGEVSVSETAYALATNGNATGRNAPLVAHPEVSGTLCASGAGLSRPAGMASEPDLCVAYEKPAYALAGNMIGRQDHNGPRGSGVKEDISFTLTGMDTGGVAAKTRQDAPIPIQDKATRCRGGGPTRNGDGCGNGLGVGKPGDPSPTITSGDHHAVAAVFNRQRCDSFKEQDIASTQAARQCKDSTDLVCEDRDGVSAVDCRNYKEIGDVSGTLQAKNKPGYSINFQNPVRAGYIVRRLTPTECERLQGFPDGWTACGADGKEISDTRRYQMLGNSVAIPCVAYVLGNIAHEMGGGA
jgi:DNA (cytosine-5)-methyltransferase 1